MEQMKALFINDNEVDFKGFKFKLKDLNLEEIATISPLINTLYESKEDLSKGIIGVLSKNTNEIYELISRVTEFKIEDIKAFNLEAQIFIISKIITLNFEFIKKNIIPMFNSIAKEASGATESKN